MSPRPLFASVTRASDLAAAPFEIEPRTRSEWATGDFVAARIEDGPGRCHSLELASGRRCEVLGGERLVAALGVRQATLEVVGDWRGVSDDGRMEVLSGGGILGKATSISPVVGRLIPLVYEGHVARGGRFLRMLDFAAPPAEKDFERPVVLVIGTSMSAGKTTAARALIRRLVARGNTVVGAKVTGAARYGDVLAMRDAGADRVFDFVDAGLPSTVCEPELFRSALNRLLGLIESSRPDVAVIEAGASPLEGYNVAIAMEALGPHLRMVVLCASDPYAVVGVMRGYGVVPDLVSGIATSTSAGVALAERLTGLPALDLLEPANEAALDRLVESAFVTGPER